MENIKTHLQNSANAERQFHQNQIKKFTKESDEVQKKLDVLLDLRISLSITQDIYDKKAKELKERQQEINAELSILHNADKEFGITLITIISLASRAYKIFESSKIEQKRQLINFMFSNLKINGEKLRFDLRKPFNLMIDLTNRPDWLGWQDDVIASLD